MMRLPDRVLDPIIEDARLEVRRCQSALDDGIPADFWRWRLEDYVRRLETASAIVRMQLAALPPATEPPPPQGETGSDEP